MIVLQNEQAGSNGANLSSAAAFIGSWTPNEPSDHQDSNVAASFGPSKIRPGLSKVNTDDDRCLLIVENAEQSEMLCGQPIERVENK